MLRPLCLSLGATLKAVYLIAMFLASVYVLFGSKTVYADPIVIYLIEGKVHVMENGMPSDKIKSIYLSCEYSIFEWVLVEEGGTSSMEGRDIAQTSSESWLCQRGECAFYMQLETGGGPVSCNWVVINPDGSTIKFPWKPEGRHLEDPIDNLYIDLATGAITVNPTSPALPELRTFLTALILAWLVEVPTIFLMLGFVFKPRYGDTKRLLGVGFLATLVTLPLAWYGLPFIWPVITLTPWVYIALVETLVVVIEALIFARLLRIPVWKAALVSLLANGLSFLVGLAVL